MTSPWAGSEVTLLQHRRTYGNPPPEKTNWVPVLSGLRDYDGHCKS